MIHAVCDFCGKDADLHATFMTLTPFENFGRYHRMTKPFGVVGKTTSFVICSDCRSKKGIPNPYCEYHNVEEMSSTPRQKTIGLRKTSPVTPTCKKFWVRFNKVRQNQIRILQPHAIRITHPKSIYFIPTKSLNQIPTPKMSTY